MNNPSTLQPMGVFRLMALPLELRCRIYYFAVVEPHPLPLITYHYNIRVYGYGVEKDLRMLDTCKEFRREMSKLLYSKNSFTYAIPRLKTEEDSKLSAIDLKRVQKCYMPIEEMTDYSGDSDIEEYWSREWDYEIFQPDFQLFVTKLAFKGHKMKYILIECEPQNVTGLIEGLGPLCLVRNIRLVHFRSRQIVIHRFFRSLEDLMMSDRPVPFSGFDAFWEDDPTGSDFLVYPGRSRPVNDLGAVVRVADKPQEQLEATAKKLYSILGIKADFIPQSTMTEDERRMALEEANPITLDDRDSSQDIP